MYQKIGAATAAGATTGLAYTGANVVWLALTAFALLAAGVALMRIAPVLRRPRSHSRPLRPTHSRPRQDTAG